MFFQFFLKGEKNGGDRQPPVQLQARHPGEKFVQRHENEWPLARTKWTNFYLDPTARSLVREPIKSTGSITYDGLGEGVTFMSAPLDKAAEITGPSALKLWVASATTDADIFAVLRVFDPKGREVVFQGALDPHTPVGQGGVGAPPRQLGPQPSR